VTARPILTAAEMRAAEEEAIAGGTSAEILMDHAGTAAAEAIWRFAGPLPALVLCGPGNNGGDGYVIARNLSARGVTVRVAAPGPPTSDAAKTARQGWGGEVEVLADAQPAPLLIDALFGTGLRQPLDKALAQALCRLGEAARVRVAVDLPSGAASDDGRLLSPVPDFDLTVTFQTLKPSHLLFPAARFMGRVVVADISIAATSPLHEIARPRLISPGPEDHKYTRGFVALLTGEMPGAGALAAAGAMRGGAGYVRIIGASRVEGVPSAVVQGPGDVERHLGDPRIGVAAVGPGLGNGDEARWLLDLAFASRHPLVLDADALNLIAERGVAGLGEDRQTPILTPHAGEFARLFEDCPGSKLERTRKAAALSRCVVVHKGPDTVVAAPDGRAAIAPAAPPWLATAGTGDVLAGVIAAMRAGGMDAFDAACAGVWLHGRAAERAGPGMIADDLPNHLPAALAECL
jgi:ADP-dependent NAD(P)H-hydrate dehydratase / NAD(P)H-hydrate epimerase